MRPLAEINGGCDHVDDCDDHQHPPSFSPSNPPDNPSSPDTYFPARPPPWKMYLANCHKLTQNPASPITSSLLDAKTQSLPIGHAASKQVKRHGRENSVITIHHHQPSQTTTTISKNRLVSPPDDHCTGIGHNCTRLSE